MAIRISGLSSGLDTEAIVQQLVSAYTYKKDSYVKAQTKLSWKQDAWKNLNKKVRSLYDKISGMRYTSAYASKAAIASDATKASITASGSAINGSYALSITKMAKSGYLTGGNLASGTTKATTVGELLGDESFAGGSIRVVSGGKTTEIAVTKDTTIGDFVDKLNKTGVKASYDATNQRIFVAAQDTGVENDFSLLGSDSNGTAALKALGLSVASTANKAEYQAWKNYAVYDAEGNYDSTATTERLNTILSDLSDAKSAIASAKNTITQNQADIITKTKQSEYASAYKMMMDAQANLDSAEEIRDLDKLSGMTSKALEKTYALDENGNLLYNDTGDLVEADDTVPAAQRATGQEILDTLSAKAGLVASKEDEESTQVTIAEYAAASKKVQTYEKEASENASAETPDTSMQEFADKVHAIYSGTDAEYAAISDLTDAISADITTARANIEAAGTTVTTNQVTLDKYALLDNGEDTASLEARIVYANEMLDKIENKDSSLYSKNATRVDGQDSVITLNGADYTSSSNTYTINGLTIEALAETGGQEITVNVKTDTDAIYNKIKDFIKQYNELINEMTSLYNADSAKGYEPLTSEEKDEMTDTEIEEWEKKIKDALLRRDDTLDGLISTMATSMSKSYEINGQKYSLASFGILTQGILNASENEENAYHIDGDEDDTVTSGKTNKLKSMIQDDPDTVIDFMKKLTSGLYDSLDAKMKSTKLSSAYYVYNDKQMDTEYKNYTQTIKKWEEKVSDMEDYYYKKFSAMETALAKLQSSSNSLSNLMG